MNIMVSFQNNYLFLKKCVENNPIVPIQEEWLASVLTLIPPNLMEGKDRENLVEELLNEVTNDYEASMKRYNGKFRIVPILIRQKYSTAIPYISCYLYIHTNAFS